MEHDSPFDLNEGLRRWRETLQRRESLREEDIAELESHVRESITELHRKGLSGEEAFLMATRRLGGVDGLDREFGKVNSREVWLARLLWMSVGVLVFFIGANLIALASNLTLWASPTHSVGGFTLAGIALATRMVVFGLLIGVSLWFIGSRNARAEAWASGCLRHPVKTVLLLTLVAVGLKVAAAAVLAGAVRTTPPTVLGQFFLMMSWGHMATTALLPLVPIVLLVARAARRGPRISGSTWLTAVAVSGLMLATGCGQSTATKPAENQSPSAEQTPLEQALSLWAAGNQDEAVGTFLKVDFTQPRLFSKGSVLSYSETEFVALPQAARESMAKQMTADLGSLKGLCRRVKELGDEARSQGNAAKADQCVQQLKRCADSLERPSSLLMVQLVGKALRKMASQ